MNSNPLKHNAAFEVPLMYLRILLTIFQCSLPEFVRNQLTYPSACAMYGHVQIIANIKLLIVDAYSVWDTSTSTSLL